MSTLALTQCWYTRSHHPAHKPKDRVDGAYYAYCRHCQRPIFSSDGDVWHIDGGFNVETLGDKANSFLSVVDEGDGMIVARVAVDPDASDEEIEAIKEELRERYRVGEDGNSLAIHDNRPGKGGRPLRKRAPPKRRSAA